MSSNSVSYPVHVPNQWYFPPVVEENSIASCSKKFGLLSDSFGQFVFIMPLYWDCGWGFLDVLARIALVVPALLLMASYCVFVGVDKLVALLTPTPSSDNDQTVYVDKHHQAVIIDKTKNAGVKVFLQSEYLNNAQINVAHHLLMDAEGQGHAHAFDYPNNTITIEHAQDAGAPAGASKPLLVTVSKRGPYNSSTISDQAFVDTSHDLRTREQYPAFMMYPYCPKVRSKAEALEALSPLLRDPSFDYSTTILAIAQSGVVIALNLIANSRQVNLYVAPPSEKQLYFAHAFLSRDPHGWGVDRDEITNKTVWLSVTWTQNTLTIDGLAAEVISYDEVRSINTTLPLAQPAMQWPADGTVLAPAKNSPLMSHVAGVVRA